jgi:large subunit ribosomal protein L4
MAERKKTDKQVEKKAPGTARPKADRAEAQRRPEAKRVTRAPSREKPEKAPKARTAKAPESTAPAKAAASREARPARREAPKAREEAKPRAFPAAAEHHAPRFAADGGHAGDEPLPAALFQAPTSGAVVHQAITAALANARQGTASTRNRSRISGGGAKPWRQKGTGRARQGSIRAPHWRHGAVVFGPNGRVYEQRLPRKMRRLALAAALTAAGREGRVAVLDELAVADGRTRSAQDLLTRIGVEGDALIVATPGAETARAFRNLERVAVVAPAALRLADVLAADRVILVKAALAELAGRAPGTPEEAAS